MKISAKVLKITGYVIMGLAIIILLYGIIHTWRNDNPVEGFAAATVILIAVGLFFVSFSQKKEKDELEKD